MLTVSNVHKSYSTGDRTVHALRGASLQIDEPGFYAIMGQSGSGKSTLLHLLGALDKPDSGEIVIAGKAIHMMDDKAATAFRRTGLGIVFQQFNLIPTLTARENVELPGLLAGDSAEKLRARSSELLAKLGIGERGEHRPDALSGGEQQRVAIARAFANRPRLILADEPTGNLDPATSEAVFAALTARVREEGAGALVATHNLALAAKMDRVVTIREGKVVAFAG